MYLEWMNEGTAHDKSFRQNGLKELQLSLISTHAFRLWPVKFFAWHMRRVVKRIEQDEKNIFRSVRI